MSKLLIYIGENHKFDLESTAATIGSLDGISNARFGKFIGAVFECNYSYAGRVTVVRISEDLETVTVEGLGPESIEFAVQLQKRLQKHLHVIDIDYTFNLDLTQFSNGSELMAAMQTDS